MTRDAFKLKTQRRQRQRQRLDMSMEQVNGTARQAVIEAACRNKKDYEPDQVIGR